MYHNGYGVSIDYAEALKWYRLSAAQGNAIAKKTLKRLANVVFSKLPYIHFFITLSNQFLQ